MMSVECRNGKMLDMDYDHSFYRQRCEFKRQPAHATSQYWLGGERFYFQYLLPVIAVAAACGPMDEATI